MLRWLFPIGLVLILIGVALARSEAQAPTPGTVPGGTPTEERQGMACVIDPVTRRAGWPAVKLIDYADNVAILGRNEADVERAADILVGAFRCSRLGPLKLLCQDAKSIRQVF